MSTGSGTNPLSHSSDVASWSSIRDEDDRLAPRSSQDLQPLRPVTVEEPETPSERRARLEREDWQREQHVLRERLVETRLPFVDQILLEKYVLRPRADSTVDQQREMCHDILAVLHRHRGATVAALRAIDAREQALTEIQSLATDVDQAALGGGGAASAVQVDLQAQALRLLYQLRVKTLAVVEAIVAWRANLNRPFPFIFQGRNYLLKIAADCAMLETGPLSKLLPLQLTLHPLLAHIPALSLFAGEAANPSAAAAGSATTAVRRIDRHTAPPPSATVQKKLEAVERYIRGELDAQLATYRDLLALCSIGSFVPVLSLPTVVPQGAHGIRLMNAEWLDKVKTSLLAGLQELLTLPDALVSGPRSEEDEGEGDEDEAAAATV